MKKALMVVHLVFVVLFAVIVVRGFNEAETLVQLIKAFFWLAVWGINVGIAQDNWKALRGN